MIVTNFAKRSLSVELTRVGENVLHDSAQTRNFPLTDATFALESLTKKKYRQQLLGHVRPFMSIFRFLKRR